MRVRSHSFIWPALLGLVVLSGCKKDDPATPPSPPPPAPPAATYTVGGTVSGLTGSVTLANNAGDARTVSANGAFTFATPLAGGAAYAVTVTTQPATQVCSVGTGSGTIAAANVTTVSITCVTKIHTVGGTVIGLAGSGLVLQNNAGDNLARTVDGDFTFATPVNSGTTYNVTVFTQPANPAQTCTPTNNTGTATANVSNVTINCVTNAVTTPGSAVIGPAGGTVNGFYGAQIIVPPGALTAPITIGLARDSSNSPDFVVADIDAVGATYELTPHGQAFAVPVTVRIPFDAAQVANDATPALYKAEAAGTFTPLTTTVNGDFLETTVSNFSWVIPASQALRPRMVYVVGNNAGALSLASFRIDRTTGALGSPTSSAVVGDFPTSAVTHPSGRFLFVTNGGNTTLNGIAPNSVSTYGLSTINGQIGGLGSTTVTRATANYRPTMPVVHPSGKFLYVMNFGRVTNEDGGDIDEFAIDGAKGGLTLTGNAITGNGSQPMGIAFNRLGSRAYVLFGGSTLSNPLSSRIAVYDVNLATGEFTGPTSTVAATAPGNFPWSIAIDPNGKALYVANLDSNEVVTFGIGSNGTLSNLGSLSVRDKPGSVVADSFGRFIFAAKQIPFFTVNTLSFLVDPNNGTLAAVNSVMSGCPGGACTGPISIFAEPQGDFVYVVESVGGLTSFAVNQQTGALTSVASRSGASVPTPGGIGFPFTYATSGTSPVWQSNCTHNCALAGAVFHTGGAGGGNPPSNPSPPTSNYLSVGQGSHTGSFISSPAGIDYAPPTNANPLGSNITANHFAANSTVQLCATPPPDAGGPYDTTWSGSCSGTGQCTSVQMNSDKFCHLEFSPVSTRVP